jgi:putative transposase
MMQSIGRSYVRYINGVYKRTGTRWEGRYQSSLIDSERCLLSCYRYITLNPVRAGLVQRAEDYLWSSYAAHDFYEREAAECGWSKAQTKGESRDAA